MKNLATLFFFLAFAILASAQTDSLDAYLHAQGLVDVAKMDASIKVDLKYATNDNFLGKIVYNGITGIWLHPDAAAKLLKAAEILKKKRPDCSFLVYDAARPMSVQRIMWNLVKGSAKSKYVSNPANGGGLHNYGLAVDLTIADSSGKPLDMGAPFDFFGEEAHINAEDALLTNGKISRNALANRLLLRNTMRQAGFSTIIYEWWHFNACLRNEARRKYKLIE
jgi:D-alanyl-D-alanine dipeptidase